MIRSLYRTAEGALVHDLTPAQIAAALRDESGLLWVDIVHEPADSAETLLLTTFNFHALAVDDALKQSHIPKIDDWGDYLYLVLHAVVFDDSDDDLVTTLELDLFLGKNYLVTHQGQPVSAVDRVWSLVVRDERHLQEGSGHLLYRLADELVAEYMPTVEAIDEAIDQIEDQVFSRPETTLLERIFIMKRALLHLRRIMAPQREVLNKLARGDYAVVAAADRMFFRDVYDHLVRLHDITESLRDLVGGVLDTYLSVVNNRMNDVMKTLTIITTLFMPLSFLVGFFGMNFFQPVFDLGAWTGQAAFGLVMVMMLILPAFMVVWMRRRLWM
ncbi:MAG: magnesium/cobalt transporter CorA [Anaerolineae bacterium]|nr:magnesium/cobalt transporter CorA [Anaerolineae bacterium]